MKKLLLAFLLLACIAAVGFASFSSLKKSASASEKKAEKKEKDCSRKCMFSL